MSFQQKLQIIAALSALVGLVAVGGAGRSRSSLAPAVLLATVSGALLIVGIVSHTLFRHVVQIAPVVAALLLVVRRSTVGMAAAAPVYAFWLLVMCGIWLFLLGIAPVFTGRFSVVEIALTITIGAASFAGLIATQRSAQPASLLWRIVTVVGFAVFQWAAMWASVQPFVARR
jgi:hypothetical protein